MKLFTKIAIISVLSDLAWHVFKLVRADQEARMRVAFRERWMTSRVGKGVTQIFYTVSGQTLSIAPGTITVTYSGGGGGGGHYTSGGGNGGK